MKTSLIITSIAAPNPVMRTFASETKKHGIDFIVIGDSKSPKDFKLNDCRFYSIEEQRSMNFEIAKILPEKHYSRKNIGYLLSKNHDVIIETDDDNYPAEGFFEDRKINSDALVLRNTGWTNVYRYFSGKNIWPRGFPLELISKSVHFDGEKINSICPIQQGLADDNPDVDAVYRMSRELPFRFEKRNPIILHQNSWCPFNSQNTTWYKDAFPLLYLPSYCSFRMTDIWRSFIAQRIAWTCDWGILFHNATVRQERNDHSLLKDFEDEVPGYLNNAKICQLLENLDLRSGKTNLTENLLRCYKMMIENKFIGQEEMKIVEAWIKDLSN